jgi:hypothetical protein
MQKTSQLEQSHKTKSAANSDEAHSDEEQLSDAFTDNRPQTVTQRLIDETLPSKTLSHLMPTRNNSSESEHVVNQIASPNPVVQRIEGEQEQLNDSTTIKETWSKEEKAFVWMGADSNYYKRSKDSLKKNPGLNDINPSDIAPEHVTLAENQEGNFTFNDVQPGNADPITMVNIDEISPSRITNLNPKGSEIRNFLHSQCHQSWHAATHHLNKKGSTVGGEENRMNMLKKIWEYRQWHHDYILRKTKNDLGGDKLTDWAAAGSTSLTSDIDVNLKGTATEEAVSKFNALFIEDGWKYEAGIVYDVNVYALDFMHKEATFGSGMVKKEKEGGADVVKDLHGNVLKKKDINITTLASGIASKEGARKGMAHGGFDGENEELIQTDRENQDIWTHVKTRLYMNQADWTSHVQEIQMSEEIKSKVEARYHDYMTTLKSQMLEESPLDAVMVVDNQAKLGIDQLNEYASNASGQGEGVNEDIREAESSNLMMKSSNRIYETKLEPIKNLREVMRSQISAYDALRSSLGTGSTEEKRAELSSLNLTIETNLVLLRNLLAEAALYSNEAYITDGAVNHAVVGIQSEVGITLKNSESKNAVVENLADTLKEINRHSTRGLGEAAFKSGKYLYRLTDAALNMGYNNETVNSAKKVSHKISTEIKNSGQVASEQESNSMAAVRTINGWESISTADEYKNNVRTMAQNIIAWFNLQSDDFGSKNSTKVGS